MAKPKPKPKPKPPGPRYLTFVLAAFASLWLSHAQAQPVFGAGASPTTQYSIAIPAATQAQTKIVSGIIGKQIYITSVVMVPGTSATVQFSYGSGTNCGTNNVPLTGVMTFPTAGVPLQIGDGIGAVMVIPRVFVSNVEVQQDLCLAIGTVASGGWLAYAQF